MQIGIGINISSGRGAGGVSYSTEGQAYFDRLATEPTAERKAAYDALISALVYSGVWAKLDALYVLAAADAATARTNLKSSSFPLTVTGSPTFSADGGYTGTGTTAAYLSTGFNPTIGTNNYVQNSATQFAWKSTAPAADHGLLTGFVGFNSYTQNYHPNDDYQWAINGGAGAANNVGLPDQTGLFGATRLNTQQRGYFGGTPLSLTTGASSLANQTLRIVGNGADSTSGQMAAAGFGANLTGADWRNLNTFLQDYFNTINSITPTFKFGYASDVMKDGATNFAPAFGRLADGRLIVAYNVGANVNDFIDAKIVYQTSPDSGRTWSAATTILATVAGRTYDSNRLTVLEDGSILLAYVDQTNAGAGNTTKIIKGTVAGDLSISWAALSTVTSGVIANPTPSGHILRLANGKLMLCLSSSQTITALFSSNDGATWIDEVTVITDAAERYGYLDYVQKSNGTIFGILRSDSTTPANTGYWTITADANGASWTLGAQLFNETPNEVALVQTPAGTLFLLARFAAPDGGAQQAGYSYSTNGGTVWSAKAIYYTYKTFSYGEITEAQGFYDSVTNSILFTLGQGNFNAPSEIHFQQLVLT